MLVYSFLVIRHFALDLGFIARERLNFLIKYQLSAQETSEQRNITEKHSFV